MFLILINFFILFLAVANYIKDNENKDPKEVVIDEVIGQSIPIYLYEIAHGTRKKFSRSNFILYIYFYFI